MPEISPKPSEEMPMPEMPEGDVETGADVLPIRPDIVINEPSETDVAAEKEEKEVLDQIKAINRKLFELKRDDDTVAEGLAEDTEEAGRQLLRSSWFSRIGGFFSKKKAKPLQYDAETRKQVVDTSMEMRVQMKDLQQQRRELAKKLDPKTAKQLEEDWKVLDRIYSELRRSERGDE